jgi:hypothetical protein
MMNDVHKTLEVAEEALLRAEAVRVAAFHAVELAREAVCLNAAGVAAELLLQAAIVAAKAVKDAEVKALEAWESTVALSLDRSIAVYNKKLREGGDDASQSNNFRNCSPRYKYFKKCLTCFWVKKASDLLVAHLCSSQRG